MTTLAASQISNAERHEIRLIIAAVCEATGVTVESMTGISRTGRVAAARQLAMTLIRERTRLSLAEIGSLFDRGHDTVIHAIKATHKRIQTDPATAAVYAGVSTRDMERPNNHQQKKI